MAAPAIYYVLVDPNWGDPRPVTATLSTNVTDVWQKAISPRAPSALHLYSGASQYPAPGGTAGSASKLLSHGYKVHEVTLTLGGLAT